MKEVGSAMFYDMVPFKKRKLSNSTISDFGNSTVSTIIGYDYPESFTLTITEKKSKLKTGRFGRRMYHIVRASSYSTLPK